MSVARDHGEEQRWGKLVDDVDGNVCGVGQNGLTVVGGLALCAIAAQECQFAGPQADCVEFDRCQGEAAIQNC